MTTANVFLFSFSLSPSLIHSLFPIFLRSISLLLMPAFAQSYTHIFCFILCLSFEREHNVNAFCEIIHHVSMLRMPHAPRRCKCTVYAQRASVSPDEYQVTRVHQRTKIKHANIKMKNNSSFLLLLLFHSVSSSVNARAVAYVSFYCYQLEWETRFKAHVERNKCSESWQMKWGTDKSSLRLVMERRRATRTNE